jgi:hypothetical protein
MSDAIGEFERKPSGDKPDVLDAIHFCDNRIAVFSEQAEHGEWIRADIEDCIDQQVWL